MKVSFSIWKTYYLIEIDTRNAEVLLTEYSKWFSKYDNKKYDAVFCFEKNQSTPKSMFDFYGLKSPKQLGINNDKMEQIVEENGCIYMNTHLFNHESVYMLLDCSTLCIHITYFSDLSVADLMSVIKTAFIWANNYLLKRFAMLLHASAVEISETFSAVFIGTSGAGKTTVAKYCHENGMSVLSDETILLWQENGNYYVQGTPWHGSEKSILGNANICKLGAMYILNKSFDDFCEKSSGSYENKCAILNQWLSCTQFNTDKFVKGTEFVADLIHNISIHRLFFTKSPRFINIIRESMQGI